MKARVAGRRDSLVRFFTTQMMTSSVVDHLKTRFGGELLVSGDGEYDAARTVFNYGAKLACLAAREAKFDPTNLFRMNQNIAPASVG